MQLSLFSEDSGTAVKKINSCANKLNPADRRIHDWYRFVLSFPPHLVQDYFKRFDLKAGDTVLDPFCGTGTTIVEAKMQGMSGIGIEANTMAHFASSVKTDWFINPEELSKHADSISEQTFRTLESERTTNLRTLPEETFLLLLKDSISPLPLHKTLALLEQIKKNNNTGFKNIELLALAKSLVFSTSNLHFGPEVGVQRIKKHDSPVIELWLAEVKTIVSDLRKTQGSSPAAVVHCGDSRLLKNLLKPCSIDAVFTSPPYPNEKDYTRTTRLESVILGFIKNKQELRSLKNGLLRSNTRNVFKNDDDDSWITNNQKIQSIANEIENRRILLGKTSGFERLYAKTVKLYFGGMAKHLANLRPFLKPGAYLGYVVGDQASYLQVMINTGQLLAEIAQSLGYKIISLDLFRTRLSTATRMQLNEEVLVLQWQGF
jgi:16S rRNA G966 N2-methylase RsmD